MNFTLVDAIEGGEGRNLGIIHLEIAGGYFSEIMWVCMLLYIPWKQRWGIHRYRDKINVPYMGKYLYRIWNHGSRHYSANYKEGTLTSSNFKPSSWESTTSMEWWCKHSKRIWSKSQYRIRALLNPIRQRKTNIRNKSIGSRNNWIGRRELRKNKSKRSTSFKSLWATYKQTRKGPKTCKKLCIVRECTFRIASKRSRWGWGKARKSVEHMRPFAKNCRSKTLRLRNNWLKNKGKRVNSSSGFLKKPLILLNEFNSSKDSFDAKLIPATLLKLLGQCSPVL